MNRLDAICIATTSQEIDSGYLQRILHDLNQNEYSNIPLLIFTNNSEYSTNVLFLNNKTAVFKYTKIVNINIPKCDDIYQLHNTNGYIPELGTISGPNIMFFFIMNFCYKQQFDTILLLETDCTVKPNMIAVCKQYVRHNNFFISGSKYLGNASISSKIQNHLNGVAFYKTGSTEFQELIQNVKAFIKKQVLNMDIIHAYDVSIFLYLQSLHKHSTFLRLISKYIQTKLIINFSPRSDMNIPNEEIYSKYPEHVILHKKL